MKKGLIDIVDKNNKELNKKTTINDAHEKGLWHRVVHVWIFNKFSEILVQLRSEKIELFPNLWDISVAGHVDSGEEPLTSAIREIKEEIGLIVNKKDLNFFKILKRTNKYKKMINNEFYYVYFLEYNKDINNLKKQESEIIDLKFIKLNELNKELKNSPERFVPHKNYYEIIIKKIEEIIKNETIY